MNPSPRFLITGLNGLIGWNIFKTAAQQFPTSGTYRTPPPLFAGNSFYKVDLENEASLDQMFQNLAPDYLIHAWAMCDLDLCEQIPNMAEKINIEGTESILGAA